MRTPKVLIVLGAICLSCNILFADSEMKTYPEKPSECYIGPPNSNIERLLNFSSIDNDISCDEKESCAMNVFLPPENDICTGATDIGLLECDYFQQYFQDPEATPDPEATGNCIDPSEAGQWYTFSTPDPIPYSTVLFNTSSTNVEIFKSSSGCSGLEYVTCSNGIGSFTPEAGTNYYLLAVGGLVMSTLWYAQNTCEDDLWQIDFDIANPYEFTWSNDCGESTDLIPCENDHVSWLHYTTGCGETDLSIEVTEHMQDDQWWWWGTPAQEVSIMVSLGDCFTLASEYDPNGLGYVCNGLAGEVLDLEDIPPGTELSIGFGSANPGMGHFDLSLLETNDADEFPNDKCDEAEQIFEGLNENLTNLCSGFTADITDPPVQGCSNEATSWYEYDPGTIPQDITINLISNGIQSPAIVAFEGCSWTNIESTCTESSLEVGCVDEIIKIQIATSDLDAGNFDLEILTSPSGSAVQPDITGGNICSNGMTDILIDIPTGENVNIDVDISPNSSTFISGMNNHNFFGTSSGTINDELVNVSQTPQEAVYVINITSSLSTCATETIEYSVMVYPRFITNVITIDECLPHDLILDVSAVIERGTAPYSVVSWYWNSSDLIGSGENLTFSLVESGQITVEVVDAVGCEESVTFDVEVTNPLQPTFDFPIQYCRSDQNFIYFETISLEGIEGGWSPTDIDVEFTEDGFYDILFTPDDLSCNLTAFLTVEIYSGYLPEFDLPALICSNEGVYTFPTEDLNGVSGDWANPSIDVSSNSGVQYNIFTPSNTNCFAVFEYEFEISDNLELSFSQPDSLCTSDASITLNDISEDGYAGSWDNPIIDPSLITEDSITRVWTPDPGQSPCIEETDVTIHILAPITPVFDLPDELCTSDPTFTFPDNDLESISGSWSITTISPSNSNGNILSVFTPNDNCIESFEWEIMIVEPLYPEFSIDTSLCALDPMIVLPVMSDNGISGNWSLPTIDPMTLAGDQVIVEFIGAALDTCIESVYLTFDIIEAEVPSFDLPESICWLESDMILPPNSMNGIVGNWEPSMIDVQSNLGESVDFVFTPLDGDCATASMYSVEVLAPYQVSISLSDPSDCMLEDGIVSIDAGAATNLEYSIDGGITWQASTEFNSLSSGGYTISIRSTDSSGCVLEESVFLNAADAPVINEVMSMDIGSCISEDGSILVDAEGNNLEYSIDGGDTWQSSNEFNGLASGEYMISIRESLSDCIVETNAIIEDIIQTEVIQVNTIDISDCNADDGRIEIIAMGESLEYSIDNGASWSAQNLFDNLPIGEYTIVVQSTIASDCTVESMVELIGPAIPEIVEIMSVNPTVCVTNIGSIEIDANGDNLEYSFDGGVTWQSSNFIDGISAGSYDIIVRNEDRIQCFIEDNIIILESPENLEESIFMIEPPTDCDLADGVLEVVNAASDLEYSVDGGLIWQNAPVFNNLTSGIYTILTRVVTLPDCNVEQSIEIPDVDCDCQDLIVQYEVTDLPCGDEMSASINLISIEGMEENNVVVVWNGGNDGTEIIEVGEGWQYYTISYDEQCVWYDSVYVEMLTPITFEWNIINAACPELDNGRIELVNINGGTGNYEYSINGDALQIDNIFGELTEGSYDIVVQDDGRCIATETIEIEAPEIIEIELTDIEMITNEESIILDPNISEESIDSFSWSPVDGVISNEGLKLEVLPEITTTYVLEIFYDDCYDSKAVTVEVEEAENGLYFGNIFSPNDDDVNDFFYIQGSLNRKTTLNNISVYDRWGNLIFNKSNPQINEKEEGWDGTLNGQKMNSGVYVYSLNFTENGIEKVELGTVTLVY